MKSMILPSLTFNNSNNNIEKWKNDNPLWLKKRNYSAKTRSRHVRSHPDYQFFGTWLVGTLPGVGTPGAAGSLDNSHQCWARSQSPILLLPSLGIARWEWGEGLALGYDAKGLSPSCSALSSTGNHCSRSQLGLCQVGIRNQGHLNNGLKITPAPTSLKKRSAKPLGSKNQMTRGELDSAMPFSVPSVQFSRSVQFSSVQSLSRVWLFMTPWVYH